MITTTEHFEISRQRSKPRGFTLIELMIVLSISSIIIMMGVSSIMFITRSSASLANYIGMNKEGRVALEVISRDIRMAMDVNSASTTTLDIDVYGQGGITNNVYYTYDTDNKTIYRELDGTKEALMGNVESFSFNYFNLRRESTTSPISIKDGTDGGLHAAQDFGTG